MASVLAEEDESAALVALIVILAEAGTLAGAVKRPLLEIVPTLEFPPATPLTLQLTLAPDDVLYCCVWVMMIEEEAGLMVNEAGVGVGSVLVELPLPPPQLIA